MSISINPQLIDHFYNFAQKSPKERAGENFSAVQNNVRYLFPSNKLLLINKNISFGSSEKASPKREPSQATMDYIAKRREQLKNNGGLVHLNRLDLDDISDICAGIPVFEHLTAKQLYIITANLDSIALQSGCASQCSHCMYDASNKVATMSWDNFTDIVDGFAVLKERLGFFPVNESAFAFYMDSEPMAYISKGKDGKFHNIFDAAKYFHEKTGLKIHITTSGWEAGTEGHKSIAQQAAESFAKHPEYLESFGISVHPFHGYMEKYKKLLHEGKKTEAEEERNKYINRMVNVVKTTINMSKKIESKNYKLFIEYNNNDESHQEAIQLSKDIFTELKKQKVDLSYFNYTDDFPEKTRNIKGVNVDRNGRTDEKTNRGCDIYSIKIIGVDGHIYTDAPYSEEYKLPYKLNLKHPNKGELSEKYKNAIELSTVRF
jgi:hypothetical protein